MKKKLLALVSLVLSLILLTGCGISFIFSGDETEDEYTTTINGIPLSDYTIIYSDKEPGYNARAAQYIKEQIKERTSISLNVKTDSAIKTWKYEIVVGETNRDISKELDPDTRGLQFAITSNDKQVALEGDKFVIAAAAYYFVNTYITSDEFNATVPNEVSICEPITEEAKNYIYLIGDGMGVYQTKLFSDVELPSKNNFSDNEDIFYGYMLPYQGFAETYSLSGVTDSAAAGTALATGYKTENGNVGMYNALYDVPSLTELAGSLMMSTAVMSTDAQVGATPAAFSAHAPDRDMGDTITETQNALVDAYGTIIKCGYGSEYDEDSVDGIEDDLLEVLDALDDNENGFFMMYEEAHIDKHSHGNDMESTFLAVLRFTQIIGTVMEYSFYNPDTFVIITADHETGDLRPDDSGKLAYNSGNHSGADVPVFAYGEGAEVFHGETINNIQIPKTIAAFWGVENFGHPELEGALTK